MSCIGDARRPHRDRDGPAGRVGRVRAGAVGPLRGWGGGRNRFPPRYPDGDQLRRRLQLLPVDVHERSPRRRRLGMVHRLSGMPTSISRCGSASSPRRRSAGSPDGEPNHLTVRITDPLMFQCPFLSATDVGTAFFTDAEAATLRDYCDKGGFLWVDDFWGPVRVGQLGQQHQQGAAAGRNIRSAISSRRHPIYRTLFEVDRAAADSVDQFLAALRRRDLGAVRAERRAALPRHRRRARPADGGDDAQHRHLRRVGAGRRRTRSSSSASHRRATRSGSTSCSTA